MIDYSERIDGLTPHRLHRFFSHWPRQPTLEDHLCLFKRSDHVVLAIDSDSGMVVGNTTAITHGVWRPITGWNATDDEREYR
jgi:hypothetical protein